MRFFSLAFGQRSRPTILGAEIAAIEAYSLADEVAVMREVLAAASDEEAERIIDSLAEDEQDLPEPEWWPRLEAGMVAAGMSPEEYPLLLADMAREGLDTLYVIWFQELTLHG